MQLSRNAFIKLLSKFPGKLLGKPRTHTQSDVHKTMLVWTFAVVVGVGSLTLIFMLQPPSTLAREEAKRKLPVAVLSEGRTPASASEPQFSAVALDLKAQSQAVDLTLPCNGTQESIFASGVTQVRLTGDACTERKEIASTEIRNEANGFSATVFLPQPRTFTTDYMALRTGENKIRILHIFKEGGREERSFIINRQPAATDDSSQ